ncbi:MAG: phosphoenolpyruvate synthase [Lachnospiraceae bacterium]|nr:phosphoenolpyruvate synthase [Lachnospiraceae bacterium]
MNEYILEFDRIGKDDISSAGGKGANLGEMTAAGVPIPYGAVLSAGAYGRFMEYNSIDTEHAGAADIRSRILNGEIPDDMQEEILSFYRSMGGVPVAVRSSATAEDLEDASFAGQQETYLNVRSDEQLLEKIKECYASLWGDRAVSYREKNGYGGRKVALAVVIQQMIESECAGVLFTKDPSAGTDEIVINASYGLGEAVVSGIVSPDEYRFDRSGRLVSAVIGTKEVMIVYDKNGTKKIGVSEEKRKERVLSDETAARLIKEALRIEAHYKHPVDIEWAVCADTIYILQARSITTPTGSIGRIFTDADFEGLPEIKAASGRMRENVLFNLEKMPRPYLPLDHDFGDNVGRQKERLLSQFGIDMKEMVPIDKDGISSFGIGGFGLNRNIFGIIKNIMALKDDEANIKAADRCLDECTKRLEAEMQTEHNTVAELGEALSRMNDLIGDTAYARFRYAIFPQVIENIGIDRKLKKIDKDLVSFDLMEGLSYVTADINREMAGLAEMIRNDGTLFDDVMKLGFRDLTERHAGLSEAFSDFLEKYGNRTDSNCYCFTSRSWNEDPDRFLATLRTLVRNPGLHIPTKEEGEAMFEELMMRIKNTLGRNYPAFEKKVIAVRHYHYIRESTQYLWESIFAYCRTLLWECAKKLGEDYDSLLYLFADEFYDVCKMGVADAGRLIGRRKEARPLAVAYWNRCIDKTLASSGNQISGVGGSAGSAGGRVKIVRSPDEFGRLEPGEVLVCPYTDPEWTPLFTLASAVVVDTGGTLSHAAIVAREYKIPCVLATGNATALLKDGDSVMVDGTAGTVYRV